MARGIGLAAAALTASTALLTGSASAADLPRPHDTGNTVNRGMEDGAANVERGLWAADLMEEAVASTGYSIEGARWDERLGAVVVAYTGADSVPVRDVVDRHLRSASAEAPVVYQRVRYSARHLADVAERILDGRAAWGGAAAVERVFAAAPSPFSSRIEVRMTARDESVEAAARRAFDVPLEFAVGQRPTATAGRYADTAPWTAGNALWFSAAAAGGSSAQCTQGFSWRLQGVVYASTAGHCATRGTSVWNGNPQQRIGEVSHRYFSHNGPTDVEFIRITSGSAGDASVWVGPALTLNQRWLTAVDNTTTTYAEVCSSGANGGIACGRMSARNMPIEFVRPDGSRYTIKGLTCVDVPAGHARPQPGDSGGPVLSTINTSTAKAWGQQVGTSRNTSETETCDFMFTPALTISAVTGATIVLR